jgi:hypothetical protein
LFRKDDVVFKQADSAVPVPNTNGVNRIAAMNLLEAKAGVLRVVREKAVGFLREFAGVFGERPVRFPESTRRS